MRHALNPSERARHPQSDIIRAFVVISLPLIGMVAWGVVSTVRIFTM